MTNVPNMNKKLIFFINIIIMYSTLMFPWYKNVLKKSISIREKFYNDFPEHLLRDEETFVFDTKAKVFIQYRCLRTVKRKNLLEYFIIFTKDRLYIDNFYIVPFDVTVEDIKRGYIEHDGFLKTAKMLRKKYK